MASNTNDLVFYDILTRHETPVSWSPNTLKVRLSLNYKGVPFESHFLSYPDIKPFLSSRGVPPHNGEFFNLQYTCPAISHPSLSKPIMESQAILAFLESTYISTPSLFPFPGSKAFAAATQELLYATLMPATGPLLMPLTPTILDARGVTYFHESRQKWFGMSIEEWGEKNGDWEKLRVSLGAWKKLCAKEEGPFFAGKTPQYADFILAGYIQWFFVLGQGERLLQMDETGGLRRLHEACKEWL